MDKINLLCAGKRARIILQGMGEDALDNVFLYDMDSSKWGTYVDAWKVNDPKEIDTNDYWCISVINHILYPDIRNDYISKYGLREDREILIDELMVCFLLEKKQKRENTIRLSNDSNRNVIWTSIKGWKAGGVEEWMYDIYNIFINKHSNHKFLVGQEKLEHNNEIGVIPVEIDNDNVLNLKVAENVIQILEENLPLTIITNQLDETFWAAVCLKRLYAEKIKIISVIHNGTEYAYDHNYCFRKDVDCFVGVSKEICEGMIERGVSKEKVKHMTCTFECSKYLDRKYSCEENTPLRIGYAGRLDGFEKSQKRLDILLNTIEELNSRNIDFRIEIAGDGEAKTKLQESVKKLGLEEKVTFLGWLKRKDISDYWRRQDIAINTADFEGRSISKFEAMANGAVPVVTDTSGVREDIEDGINGYIVPLRDYMTICDRIEYLNTHRKKMEDMGLKAHSSIYPKSNLNNHIEMWENLLNEIG